jgi:hypothetical protein
MVKKNNNMKRRRCRRRQRQQLERVVLELTEMRQNIQQLRATEESHNGSMKTLFLSLGDTNFVAEKLQVKVEKQFTMLSVYQLTCSTVLAGFSEALKNISTLCYTKKRIFCCCESCVCHIVKRSPYSL